MPFTVTIPKEEKDKTLLAKLKQELCGILAWAVRGCEQWQQRGLDPPREVRAATEEYREEMDPVKDFIDQCCELSRGAKIAKGALYHAYTDWCREQETEPESHKWFAARLEERGIGKHRTGSARYWVGIRLGDG